MIPFQDELELELGIGAVILGTRAFATALRASGGPEYGEGATRLVARRGRDVARPRLDRPDRLDPRDSCERADRNERATLVAADLYDLVDDWDGALLRVLRAL